MLYPAGTFSIDGVAFQCGRVPIIVDTSISDVGMAGYGLIYLNTDYFEGLPTGLRLWWANHECAHHIVGTDEMAADCWAVRKGRDEGWFPPEMFRAMKQMFADNRGDQEHASGLDRLRNMRACYKS